MRAAAELQGPIGHDDRWVVIALVALGLVALYYVVVLWSTRARPPRELPVGPTDPWLARLDALGAAVARGELTARQGHQQLSSTVRAFVAERSGVPASTMTLVDFREHGPERLAEVVALTYPPSFSHDEDLSTSAFEENAARARAMVASWT